MAEDEGRFRWVIKTRAIGGDGRGGKGRIGAVELSPGLSAQGDRNMAGLVPGIHVPGFAVKKAFDAGQARP